MKLTPVFEQYLSIKNDYPDALLFFRMGDFYELFFEDAEITARELQIVLTSRNGKAEHKIPMCGVPHHATEGYVAQLLEKGYKVAICDQIEDPKQAKGLVKRAVTRVLTPGTVVEDSSLSAKTHNYLAAAIWDTRQGRGGLCWIDYSTGEWSGIEVKREPELWQWTLKVAPRELLLIQGQEMPYQYQELAAAVTHLPPGSFDHSRAGRKMLEVQQVADLGVLDLGDKKQLVRACGAVLVYLEQTQKREMDFFREFKPLNVGKHLILDEVTERNLELFRTLDGRKGGGTLWQVMDKTMTSMGGRMLETRLRNPWRELSTIQANQDAVDFFHRSDALRAELRTMLDTVYDLERLTTRIHVGRATPKDFVALRESLANLPSVRNLFENHKKLQKSDESLSKLPRQLISLMAHWDDLDDIFELLESAFVDSPPPVITDGGLFKHGFDPELDEFIELTEHGESTLSNLLEKERDENELPKLKLGFNKVFGYYFELSKAVRAAVPEHFIRRQTLVNSERYITEGLKELEEKILSASEDRKKLEYNLFQDMRQTMTQARPRLSFMAQALAGLDFWQGLAEAARLNSWTRPGLSTGLTIKVHQGRHPVVEAGQGSANYIPNDLTMDEDGRMIIITGPNMAGKSTVLRQTAIMLIMAQIGSFVPATKATFGLADRIFSRVGASDNLAQGRSTFMVEMMETARIMRQATVKSLVILDEIGRGTSTFDGLALAWAVVEDLCKRGKGGVRTLFATHYHELTDLEKTIPQVRNMNIAVKEWKGDIVFLRKLIPGPADKSYGIEVAKLAGVPGPVVVRARELLHELEERALESQGVARDNGPKVQTLLPGLLAASAPGRERKDAAPHPVLSKLEQMDPHRLTPIQALSMLEELKQMLDEDES